MLNNPVAGPHVAMPQANNMKLRQITHADIPAIAGLLHQGFPDKPKDRFLKALQRLSAYEQPRGTPQLGFMLEAGAELVGALLAISSYSENGTGRSIRCNVACWYVLPDFRVYAPLLVLQIGRNPAVTYINISAARGTWQTIEAQGFRRFSTGAFAGVPALAARCRNVKVKRISAIAAGADGLSAHELKLLRDHEQFGCVSLVCEATEGVHPFVFRRRYVRRFPLPAAQLIYCRDLRNLSRFASPIGRFLALSGMMWVLVATPQPVPNMIGKYFRDKSPMYFKGPDCPAAGDLAYTEAALFGF